MTMKTNRSEPTSPSRGSRGNEAQTARNSDSPHVGGCRPATGSSAAKIARREFLCRSVLASAGLGAATQAGPALAAEQPAPAARRVTPGAKGTLPTGALGKLRLSRLISGGNLLSGWCHQRDLLFVRNLAEAYLTETRQFDTLQLLEESGVNSIVIDMVQLGLVNRYRKERGGQMRTIASVRQDWGGWGNPRWDDLQTQIRWAMDQGADTLYVHGGYADRLVQSGHPERIELLGKAIEFIRRQGLVAGLGAHALEVPQACDQHGIQPDYYVKTFHHDQYWSATPRDRRKPFCADGPRHLDHNEFHDNIWCLDAEATAAYMLDKPQPWIAFKVLAAGAIPPKSGFQYAFENGADFVAAGMFDFEVAEDVQTVAQVLKNLRRERPWIG